jgi:hypothetical protein
VSVEGASVEPVSAGASEPAGSVSVSVSVSVSESESESELGAVAFGP